MFELPEAKRLVLAHAHRFAMCAADSDAEFVEKTSEAQMDRIGVMTATMRLTQTCKRD